MIQFSVTCVTSAITSAVLILTLNNTKNLKKIQCPGTVQTVIKIPFWTLSNKSLKTVLFGGSSKTLPKSFSKSFDKKTTEKLKTFCEVSQLFDQSENSVSCDYYTPYELNKIKVKQEDLSVLHLNISSLSAHIDDRENRIKFDIICISESRLLQKNLQTTDIKLAVYNIEQTPNRIISWWCSFVYISKVLQ